MVINTDHIEYIVYLEDHMTCNTAAFESVDWPIVYKRSFHLFLSFSSFGKAIEKQQLMSSHGQHSEVVSTEDFPFLPVSSSRASAICVLNMIIQWRQLIKKHLSIFPGTKRNGYWLTVILSHLLLLFLIFISGRTELFGKVWVHVVCLPDTFCHNLSPRSLSISNNKFRIKSVPWSSVGLP